jgi:mycoredoxin
MFQVNSINKLYLAQLQIAVFYCLYRGAKAACSVHGSPSGWHNKSVSTDFHELRQDFSPPNHVLQKRNLCPFSVYNRKIIMDDLYIKNPSQIVMYTTQYCPDCRRAREFFETHNVEYLRVDLEGNAKAIEFVMRINNGCQSVPTIIFPDGSILVEPSRAELQEKIFRHDY